MTAYYADRVMPGGIRVPIKPGGRRTFNRAVLAWLRIRARRKHYKMIVGTVNNPRDLLAAFMRWALSNEHGIHYLQVRPMHDVNRMANHQTPVSVDCSTVCTASAKSAGLRDPNGLHYNGSGNTQSLRQHLPRRHSPGDCRIGDPIVYGRDSSLASQHVAQVFQTGSDPLMFSHGQENGPRLYRHSVEAKYHGGVFTCHDITRG